MNVPFAQVANSVLNDKNLTWEAKGLYAYIYSKPENWDFSAKRIADDSPFSSRESVERILNELEEAGYLKRSRLSSGKMNYFLTHDPVLTNVSIGSEPVLTNILRGQTSSEDKRQHISNKELNSRKKEEIQERKRGNSLENSLTRSEELVSFIVSKGIPESIARAELEKFVSYWTESSPNGKKQRWQMEKVFDVRRRLSTWFSRVHSFSKREETKGIRI